MASRMDRYSKSELITEDRTKRNQKLYEDIQNLNTYTNIECVSSIEQSNEVDISKVKEMINNRENYKTQRKLNSIHSNLLYDKPEEEIVEEDEPIKNYDINDALDKAKENINIINSKYRSLDDKQYEELESLNIKVKVSNDIEEENREEVFDNELSSEDDMGLLDELKSNTMVGDASSIKKIIEEEKDSVVLNNGSQELDKSFYTSSFGFKKKDFEDLEEFSTKEKNGHNKVIIILFILIIIVGIGVYIYLSNFYNI